MHDYTSINSKIWDLWAENGCEWSIPLSHDDYAAVTEENFGVYLTPCRTVPHEWFGEIKGKRMLGLASGGGQQMPVFSKLGAICTVLDYSEKQLDAERMVAARERYAIEIIKGDMTQHFPFEDESFDIVFHPVSNCYVEDVYHIWKECYRVLKKGGRLLAGFDNGLNFLFEDENPLLVVNKLPYNPLTLPKEHYEALVAAGRSIQFSHTLEEQIGGQLKAGFTLKALYEDRDREGGAYIRDFAPQYIATWAIK